MATLQNYAPLNFVDGPVTRLRFPEAASQSFKAGDLVILSSGKVAISVAAGNSLDTDTKILGMALEPATGVTDTMVSVLVFLGSVSMDLPVYHGTPASAVTAVANNGTAYALYHSSTGGFMVDLSNTTKPNVRQVTISPRYPVGEQYGIVTVTFDPDGLLVSQ